MKIRFLALSAILILAFSVTAFAQSGFSGKVVRVADGDTITVLAPGNQQVKVRLYGIDCPEKGQAFGQKARHFTAERVAGRNVQVSVLDTDRYGRAVGVVKTEDGGILNQELLTNGYAWLYTRYCKASFCSEWQAQEMRARKAKVGSSPIRRPLSRGAGERQTREDDKFHPPRFSGGQPSHAGPTNTKEVQISPSTRGSHLPVVSTRLEGVYLARMNSVTANLCLTGM